MELVSSSAIVLHEESVCPGSSFLWDVTGLEYNAEGEYPAGDSQGCEASDVLRLSYFPRTQDVLNSPVICEGDVYEYEGEIYDETGVYTIEEFDENNCTFRIIIELKVLEMASGEEEHITLCLSLIHI